jgi:hypothetical protein
LRLETAGRTVDQSAADVLAVLLERGLV